MSATPQPELIWMAAKPSLNAPIEGLTHLLAAALAKDLPKEPLRLVTVNGTSVRWEKWNGTRFVPGASLTGTVTTTILRGLIPLATPWCGRVFVVHVTNPLALPPPWVFTPGMRFDRVVYITDIVPTTITPALANLAASPYPGNRVPYFTAIVPSVMGPAEPAHFPQDWIPGHTPPFAVQRMKFRADLTGTTAAADADRLFRDAVRLGMDLVAITAKWAEWVALGKPNAFIDFVNPGDAKRAKRWGRAASNRRVGVAVSGGGASAFRARALFEALDDNDVPVDVVTGMSGGAVVGAYYCEKELAGLQQVEDLGLFFQFALPVVIFSSWPLQAIVDYDLGSARVQDSEIRFAPVTTELQRHGPPHSTVVTNGTVGSAVRASGCLPPAFAPMVRNHNRYTDGGAAAIVPAQILRDCGADLSVACNIIPGAAESNPLDMIPIIGECLHDWTPLGRILDVWVWYTFMWSQASRSYGEVADVYLEFEPAQIPFVECFLWVLSRWIAAAGRGDQFLGDAVNKVKVKWTALQTC